MICIDCEYSANVFDAQIAGISSGVFIYMAKCPVCGGTKVNQESSYREDDLCLLTAEKWEKREVKYGHIKSSS